MLQPPLAELLYPAAKARKEDLTPITMALSGGRVEPQTVFESVYIAKYLMDYWVAHYNKPPDDADSGPDPDDDLQQVAFADFVEMFTARTWLPHNSYSHMLMLGYDCTEVENTVPEDWRTNVGWVDLSSGREWRLQVHHAKEGRVFRLRFYSEGFGLDFWFYLYGAR